MTKSDTMTYVSFTKGFKPGGSNLTFGFPVDDEQNFGAQPAPQLVFPFLIVKQLTPTRLVSKLIYLIRD